MFVVEILNDRGPYTENEVFGPFTNRALAEEWGKADIAAGGCTEYRLYEIVPPPNGENISPDGRFLVDVVPKRGLTTQMFGPFSRYDFAEDWSNDLYRGEETPASSAIYEIVPPRTFRAESS